MKKTLLLAALMLTACQACVRKPSHVTTTFKNDDGKTIAVLDKSGHCFVVGEKGGLFPTDSSVCDRLPAR